MNTTNDDKARKNDSFIIDMSQIMDEIDETQTRKSNGSKSMIYTLSKGVICAFAIFGALFIAFNAFYGINSNEQGRTLNEGKTDNDVRKMWRREFLQLHGIESILIHEKRVIIEEGKEKWEIFVDAECTRGHVEIRFDKEERSLKCLLGKFICEEIQLVADKNNENLFITRQTAKFKESSGKSIGISFSKTLHNIGSIFTKCGKTSNIDMQTKRMAQSARKKEKETKKHENEATDELKEAMDNIKQMVTLIEQHWLQEDYGALQCDFRKFIDDIEREKYSCIFGKPEALFLFKNAKQMSSSKEMRSQKQNQITVVLFQLLTDMYCLSVIDTEQLKFNLHRIIGGFGINDVDDEDLGSCRGVSATYEDEEDKRACERAMFRFK